MITKQPLVWICLALLVLATSCEKYNPDATSGTPRTPYVLFVGGLVGSVYKTNDGEYYKPMHAFDDVTVRQILTADTNILYLKGNCYVSDDEGRAFNVSNTNPRPYYDDPLYRKHFLPHQMIFDSSEQRVYLCVDGGLEQSDDFGKTFTNSAIGISPTSIIEMDNNDVFAIQDDANIRVNASGSAGWTNVVQGSSVLAAGSNYYLTSYGDKLIATDYEGVNGSYFSTNGGADWTKFGGVAPDKLILFVNSVENPNGGLDVFMGRDSMGLFKLNPNTNSFEASSAGIPWYAKVMYVESKKIVFKTGEARYFYYCATDVGLFRSEEESAGADWIRVRAGEFSTLE